MGGGKPGDQPRQGGADARDRRVDEERREVPRQPLLELGQGRCEKYRRRRAGRLGIRLEAFQPHPQHRKEKDKDDQPTDNRPHDLRNHGAPAIHTGGDHRLASTWKMEKSVRSANVATTVVMITATTPIADACPMLKPWKATR